MECDRAWSDSAWMDRDYCVVLSFTMNRIQQRLVNVSLTKRFYASRVEKVQWIVDSCWTNKGEYKVKD